ncbi:MAG: hypothetical protein KDA57_21580 [Planctomycetales bacterium]|nr:hypothetical protein [Planctomycetales bacterium]
MSSTATKPFRSPFLRVKLKSLAEEARIVRREERKAHSDVRSSLHDHRVHVVRKAARNTHIAYGLLLGKTLEQIEGTATPARPPDWKAIEKMVRQYGPTNFELKLAA